MSRLIFLLVVSGILLSLDYYFFQAFRTVFGDRPAASRRLIYGLYWGVSLLLVGGVAVYNLFPALFGLHLRRVAGMVLFAVYFSKLFASVFLFVDDLMRVVQWAYVQLADWFQKPPPSPMPDLGGAELADAPANTITRSEFLAKSSLVAATVPLATMSWGILRGAHDYQVRRLTVALPHLPKAFDGLKLAQLSDIHSGSFFNRLAVQGGVDLLLAEKPDLVLFTGDLVNNEASEMKDYFEVFKRVKAPLGVYSTLGNHDYGDYVRWESRQAKQRNLQSLMDTHRQMGWDLLMNEHRMLRQGSDQLAIIGIENWGAKGNFPKYGKLAQAHAGTHEAPVKLLLSHDPSHWDAQVRPEFPDIDLMFAGHTHGMQFGVEIGNFKWSPIQYFYDRWAGLYEEGRQRLYVNRGFGYLGFPGRIGILPEITIMELRRA
jgi:predicted MPP superfamily phosphohydrolase